MSVSSLWPPKRHARMWSAPGLGTVLGTTGDSEDHTSFYLPHAPLNLICIVSSASQKHCSRHTSQPLSVSCNSRWATQQKCLGSRAWPYLSFPDGVVEPGGRKFLIGGTLLSLPCSLLILCSLAFLHVRELKTQRGDKLRQLLRTHCQLCSPHPVKGVPPFHWKRMGTASIWGLKNSTRDQWNGSASKGSTCLKAWLMIQIWST